MTRKISGILFDLGDTLLDFGKMDIPSLFEAGARQAWEQLQQWGQPVPSFGKYHRKQLWAIRWNYFLSRFTRREFNSMDLMRRLAKSAGQVLSEEQLDELSWLWYEPLSRTATLEDGLRDMLQRLADKGLKLGIVSNTFIPAQTLDRHLEQAGLIDLFPVRIYSCQVRYRKPDRRIFQMALDELELAGRETVFVGDSIKADIQGAKALGMITVLKDPIGAHKADKMPDYRVERVTDLEGVLSGFETAGEDR